MKCILHIVALLLLLLPLACGGRRAEDREPVRFDVLTPSDLTTFSNAYQAIQTLRPAWLRTRAAGGFQAEGQVWVYRDGMRAGGVDRLRNINTVEIQELRYYDGISASQRWGLGHENGVIHVTSRVRQ